MGDLVPILAITSSVLIPVGGLMLILTTRFAFKPMVESITEALREMGHGAPQVQPWQIQELQDQMEALTAEVRRLGEAQDFDRKLLASESRAGTPAD